MTDRSKLLARAVKFLTNDEVKGTVQAKMAYLSHKGLTDTEILEALNQASGGALVEAALGD